MEVLYVVSATFKEELSKLRDVLVKAVGYRE